MLTKVKKSLSKINYKLFLALLVLGLVPTIYTTVRVFFVFDCRAIIVGKSFIRDFERSNRVAVVLLYR